MGLVLTVRQATVFSVTTSACSDVGDDYCTCNGTVVTNATCVYRWKYRLNGGAWQYVYHALSRGTNVIADEFTDLAKGTYEFTLEAIASDVTYTSGSVTQAIVGVVPDVGVTTTTATAITASGFTANGVITSTHAGTYRFKYRISGDWSYSDPTAFGVGTTAATETIMPVPAGTYSVVLEATVSAVVYTGDTQEVTINATAPLQTVVDTTYSLPTGGTDWTPATAALFQAALDSAVLGDTITLTAGTTYAGNFKLPAKTGTGWIYIKSSALASLPPAGTRVAVSDATDMPQIESTNTLPAIVSMFEANHYRFVGCEIKTNVAQMYNLVMIGEGLASYTDSLYTLYEATTTAQLPTYIIFDRCLIRSVNAAGKARCGIMMNGRHVAAVDCYFAGFKDTSDAQCINPWNGGGPYKIDNCYLEATGENFMAGGADPQIPNAIPSDIQFTRNYCYKLDVWDPDHASYGGNRWTIKNLFELKNAQRVLVEGNIFANCHHDDQGQSCTGLVLTPRNQSNTAPWCVVKDVLIQNNLIYDVGIGLRLMGRDDIYVSAQTDNVTVTQNHFLTRNYGDYHVNMGCHLASYLGTPALDVTITHNTFLSEPAPGASYAAYKAGFLGYPSHYPQLENLVMQDNIFAMGVYGLDANGTTEGIDSINSTLNPTFDHNLFILQSAGNSRYAWQKSQIANYYPSNSCPDEMTAVGFTDWENEDFSLTALSTYHNAASDSTDPGPNWTTLTAATAGCLTGVWP